MQFKELKINPAILKALKDENYTEPTPIQEKAIPPILNGKDIIGCAQTGTGKTAAFAIPTLQLLCKDKTSMTAKKQIRALIITPTRELALQIYESFCTYGKYTNLNYCVIFGGVSQKPQEEKLQKGVDILVATPGRLNDLMNQKLVCLEHLEIFILDEADRMLDMGFIHDVKKIIAQIPAKKQTLLFSATMPPEILRMSDTLLSNPVKVTITPVSSTVDIIKQYLYYVDKENKKDLLLHILKEEAIESVLIFTRTKHGADRLVRQLMKQKISSQAIHGDKGQNARQLALENFKNKKLQVLVATDIAARGIDIDELSHVINFDLPDVPETYVHRIGRTGRAGSSGTAISFCNIDEKEMLDEIERLIRKRIEEVKDHPYPLLHTTLTKKTIPNRQKTSKESTTENKKFRMTANGTLKEKKSNYRAKSNRTENGIKESKNTNKKKGSQTL